MNAMNQQQQEPLMLLLLPCLSFDPRARNWRTTFTTQDDDGRQLRDSNHRATARGDLTSSTPGWLGVLAAACRE